MNVLIVPPENFLPIIHVLRGSHFRHAVVPWPEILRDLIVLELTFISGRPKDTRLALFKELNARIVTRAEISPDDLLIQLYEPRENITFGRGLAQRAFVSA